MKVYSVFNSHITSKSGTSATFTDKINQLFIAMERKPILVYNFLETKSVPSAFFPVILSDGVCIQGINFSLSLG